MATPIKSPTLKSNDTPAIISDFKNRFHQHQMQLMQNHATNQQQLLPPPPPPPQSLNTNASALESKFGQIREEEYIVIDKNDLEECKKMQFQNLGHTIKESINTDEMARLSLLAKFYSELILSNSYL